MNLVIDIGNTATKAALFEGGRLVEVITNRQQDELNYDSAIIVSTREETDGGTELEKRVRERATRFIKFNHATPVPIKNLYATPQTLGLDRVAAAVGASVMFPGQAALICDFGTAITYDLLTARGEFLGGSISPGAQMRFRALHEFTGRLPMVGPGSMATMSEFPAKNTEEAIRNGVVTGIVAETEAYIMQAKERLGENVKIIFTGGDADYFASCGSDNYKQGLYYHSPCTIFVASELVLYGLNAILEHNAK